MDLASGTLRSSPAQSPNLTLHLPPSNNSRLVVECFINKKVKMYWGPCIVRLL